jgi:hypothetical protein
MSKYTTEGAVLTKEKDCRGEGCPNTYCKMRSAKSKNKCLGGRVESTAFGKPWHPWRCEYSKMQGIMK